MFKKLSLLSFIVLLVSVTVFHTGCAVIIPPGGGPKDSLPPVLMQAVPALSAKNFNTNKIVLNFDEYVEVKGIQDNLIVSPLPKINPVIDYKLKTVTIKLRDSLLPNTTYSLNFGNGLVDVNEGNPLKGFNYVFSTGKYIDSSKLAGNVMLAETGTVDTTLIAVLYSNLNDTAVLKTKPVYMAKINNKGDFHFEHLPNQRFNLFVMPNDYLKRYDDSTKMFAFADSSQQASLNPVTVKLLAFEEAKKKEKKTTATKIDKKKLVYTTSLDNFRQDLLSKYIVLTPSNKLKKGDSTKIRLVDTAWKTIESATVMIDTAVSKIYLNNQWKAADTLRLIVDKMAMTDTFGNHLEKDDTIKFAVNKVADYGSLKIRFSNVNLKKNPVIQIYFNDQLVESKPLIKNELFFKLFHTGEFEVRVLYDENQNGYWDTGNYKQHKQPEKVEKFKNKVSVKANWDNESELAL